MAAPLGSSPRLPLKGKQGGRDLSCPGSTVQHVGIPVAGRTRAGSEREEVELREGVQIGSRAARAKGWGQEPQGSSEGGGRGSCTPGVGRAVLTPGRSWAERGLIPDANRATEDAEPVRSQAGLQGHELPHALICFHAASRSLSTYCVPHTHWALDTQWTLE